MNLDALDQREFLVSEIIEMFERGTVIDESPQDAGTEQPSADGVGAGIDLAEFDRERGLKILSGDFGGDDSKIGEQTLFVFHNLWLRGNNANIASGSVAFVLHHYRQRIRDARLHFDRERIISEHIALMKVFYRETRAGVHGDHRR